MHLAMIILALIGVLVVPSSQNAKAIPYFSPQDLYNLSDMVFYGQVLTKGPGPGPDYYYYQVQVITYFKNQQTSDIMIVAGHKSSDPSTPYPQFEVGDDAIFYIKKIDGVNTIYWNSQISGNACTVQSFLESSPVSSNRKIGPSPSNHIYIEDANGTMPYIPLTSHTAVFHDDDVWNNYPESRAVPITLSIVDEDDGLQVFNQTQTLEMQACSGPEKVQWNFIPTQIANYVATITDDKSKISMIFNSMLDVTKSQALSSSLEQLRFGIDPPNVICKQDLHLVIKSEDGSPACVNSESARHLIERGWATNKTNQEWFNLVDEHVGKIAMNKNGTVSAMETISMHMQHFKVFSPPVVFKVFYTNGTLYKTDKISSNDIPLNGYYNYNLTISSQDAANVFGEHRVYVERNGDAAEMLVRIPASP